MADTPTVPTVVSPTGLALVKQWVVWIGMALGGICSVLVAMAQAGVPLPPWLVSVATSVIGFLALLGIASPGVRNTAAAQLAGQAAAKSPGGPLNS